MVPGLQQILPPPPSGSGSWRVLIMQTWILITDIIPLRALSSEGRFLLRRKKRMMKMMRRAQRIILPVLEPDMRELSVNMLFE